MADSPVASGTTGWSVETLFIHFMELRRSDDMRYTERFQTKQRADEQQARDLTTRLAGVNEFRDTLRDQQATFVTRDTVDALIAGLDSKIGTVDSKADNVDKRVTTNEGRNQGATGALGYIVGVFGVVGGIGVTVLSHFWK
jgi:hypothetical protein